MASRGPNSTLVLRRHRPGSGVGARRRRDTLRRRVGHCAEEDLRAGLPVVLLQNRAPARFVARRDTPLREVVPEGVEGKKIAVVARSAHEQYLKAFFTEGELKSYPNMEAAREALRTLSAS